MSKITLSGAGTGTGTFTLAAPATNTNRTLSLPDEAGTMLTSVSDITTQVKSATNATGDAPVYACRAWTNFDGTGTVAIRASGNVSSITDNGTGDYTVNFTTAMPDADYTLHLTGGGTGGLRCLASVRHADLYSTTQARTYFFEEGLGVVVDPPYCGVAIFR